MKRIAIFVEGQTEVAFVVELLRFTLSEYKYTMHVMPKSNKYHNDKQQNDDRKEVFVLIKDCTGGGGDSVLSAICEHREKQFEKGYGNILGLQDWYNGKSTKSLNKEKLVEDERRKCKNLNDQRISFHYAVMETEAWFLADYKLFSLIDPKLTPQWIKDNITNRGKPIDLITDDPETCYEHPTEVVKKIFETTTGYHYRKKKSEAETLAGYLDFQCLCQELRNTKIHHFHEFCDRLLQVLQ